MFFLEIVGYSLSVFRFTQSRNIEGKTESKLKMQKATNIGVKDIQIDLDLLKVYFLPVFWQYSARIAKVLLFVSDLKCTDEMRCIYNHQDGFLKL